MQRNPVKETKMQWLPELCRKHVETYVVHSEVASLVQQTHEVDQANQESFPCRSEGCEKTSVFHSKRVQ